MRTLFRLVGEKAVGRRDLRKQFYRYRQTVLWLYAELLKYSPSRTILSVGANVVGVTVRGGALSLLIVYASFMESEKAITLLDYEVASRAPLTFYTVVIGLGILLLISSGIVFLGSRAIIKLANHMAANFSFRCVTLARPNIIGQFSKIGAPYPRTALTRATSVVAVSRGIQPLLQISNPAAMFTYSLIVVMYLDPLLTLALGAIVALSLFFQYLINYHSVQNEKKFNQAKRRSGRWALRTLDRNAKMPVVHPTQLHSLSKEYRYGDIQDLLDRFAFRTLAGKYSGLVSDVVLAVGAAILLLYLGGKALGGEVSWAAFLGYILFARLVLVALRQLLSGITGFARHYPRIRALYETLQSEGGIGNGMPKNKPVKIRGRDRSTIGNLNRIDMFPGNAIGIISSIPVSRFTPASVFNLLKINESCRPRSLSSTVVTVPDALRQDPGGTIDELIDTGVNECEEDLRSIRARMYGDISNYLSQNSGIVLAADSWWTLPLEVRANILLYQSLTTPGLFIFVESSVLATATESFRAYWWEGVNSRFVIIRYPITGFVLDAGIENVILIGDDESVGICTESWLEKNFRQVAQWFQAHSVKETGSVADQPDDWEE